jgi:hypothetical protein
MGRTNLGRSNRAQKGATNNSRINMHTERDKKFSHNYLAKEKTCVYMGEATYFGWQGKQVPPELG